MMLEPIVVRRSNFSLGGRTIRPTAITVLLGGNLGVRNVFSPILGRISFLCFSRFVSQACAEPDKIPVQHPSFRLN